MQFFVSNQNQPHDAVGVTMWLIMLAEGRRGEDGMTVNQERDIVGRAKNGINLGRLSLGPISRSKNQPIEAMQNAGKSLASCSERYSGSTYNHLSDTGSWESV